MPKDGQNGFSSGHCHDNYLYHNGMVSLDMSVVETVTLESLVLGWVTQTQAITEYNS